MSDAWVFISVAHGATDEAASLTDVYATADAYNHAPLMDSELVPGINRLVSAGLISLEGNRFRLTPSGHALLRESEASSTISGTWNLHRLWELLAQRFRELRDPSLPAWSPAPEELRVAWRQYVESWPEGGARSG